MNPNLNRLQGQSGGALMPTLRRCAGLATTSSGPVTTYPSLCKRLMARL